VCVCVCLLIDNGSPKHNTADTHATGLEFPHVIAAAIAFSV